MGLDYSINLYFPTRRLSAALQGLLEMASPIEGANTTIGLPDHEKVVLPFTSNWKTDPVDLVWGSGKLKLETSLLFPFDDAIRRQNAFHATEVVDGTEYAEIGYIYLTVSLGCLFAEFSFTAATSGMSRAFVQSESIRSRFGHLLAVGGGVAAWLDQEDFEFYSLDDPSRTFSPPWKPVAASNERLPGSVDEFTMCLCEGLGRPVPESTVPSPCKTVTVLSVARSIHDQQAFERLPILADALEDAGCVSQDVLFHCRQPGKHGEHCCVVNLILAKE